MSFDSTSVVRGAVLFAALVGCIGAIVLLQVRPAEAATGGAQLASNNGGRIVLLDADGSDRRFVTNQGVFPNYESKDSSPEISPDGSRIAFLRGLPGQGGRISVMLADIDGTSVRPLIESGKPESGYPADPSYVDPSWSPDGKWVYFIQYGGEAGIWRAPANALAGRAEPVMKLKSTWTDQLTDIDFSPDGTKLLAGFEGTSDRSGHPTARFRLVDPETGASKLLVRDGSNGDWSPDGSKIVFSSKRDLKGLFCHQGYCQARSYLYVMNADGTGARKLMPGRDRIGGAQPRWSPDGSRIAFTSYEAGSEIYSVKPDGKCLTWLTNGSPDSTEPAWNPAATGPASAGRCGAGNLKPTIEYAEPKVGDVAGMPSLWLGPAYGSNAIDSWTPPEDSLSDPYWDSLEKRTHSYENCLNYKAEKCPKGVYLVNETVCSTLPVDADYFFGYSHMMRYRGALVYFDSPRFSPPGAYGATVLTGGRAIEITVNSVSPYGQPRKLSRYLRIIDQLRPVWQTDNAKGNLPPARLGLKAIAYYKKLERKKRGRTMVEAANALDILPRKLRTQLGMFREMKRLGPILPTTKCGQTAKG